MKNGFENTWRVHQSRFDAPLPQMSTTDSQLHLTVTRTNPPSTPKTAVYDLQTQ